MNKTDRIGVQEIPNHVNLISPTVYAGIVEHKRIQVTLNILLYILNRVQTWPKCTNSMDSFGLTATQDPRPSGSTFP